MYDSSSTPVLTNYWSLASQSGGLTGTFYAGNSSYTTANSTTVSGYFSASSDYRIKENIEPLNVLDSVDLLKPIKYTQKGTKKPNIGFLAHEVQEIFPFLVEGEKDGETTQSLNYIGLIGVLTKEIQDLKHRVKELENKIT